MFVNGAEAFDLSFGVSRFIAETLRFSTSTKRIASLCYLFSRRSSSRHYATFTRHAGYRFSIGSRLNSIRAKRWKLRRLFATIRRLAKIKRLHLAVIDLMLCLHRADKNRSVPPPTSAFANLFGTITGSVKEDDPHKNKILNWHERMQAWSLENTKGYEKNHLKPLNRRTIITIDYVELEL